MHEQIKESGLGAALGIRHMTTNPELAKFLGKNVLYKRELLEDPEFLNSHGTVSFCTFHIKEVQKDFAGRDCLRGYAIETNDTFGRVIDPGHVYLVE